MNDLLSKYGEAFLKAVLEALPIGVWIVGPEGEVEFGNRAGREVWGGMRHVGPENYSDYKAWWADTGKPLRSEDWGAHRALRKGETSIGEILQIEAFDRIRKTIWHAAVPVKDDQGKILGVAIVNQDITQMREIEERCRMLLETAHDGIVTVDEEGLIVMANRRAASLFGYEVGELIGVSVETLVPERLRESHLEKRKRYMQNPVPRPIGQLQYLMGRKKDGTEVPMDITLSPIRFGSEVQVTAILRDASARHRSDRQMRFLIESSRVLNETIDYGERLQKTADLVVPELADACVVRTACNGELRYVASSHRDPVKKRQLQELLAGLKTRSDSPWGSAAVIRTGKPQFIEEVTPEILKELAEGEEDYRKLLKIGIRSWIVVPLLARGKTIGALLLFMSDSGRRFTREDQEFAQIVAVRSAMALDNARLYGEAQQAIQAREEVLALVSHDLKNPLSVVASNSAMIPRLVSGQENGPELRKIADRIQRSSERMTRLVSDLLDYSKIQAGTFSVEPRRSGLGGAASELLESMRPMADEKKLSLHASFAPEDPQILCDPDRILQVLSNLVGNAIKFTPEGGRIEVRSRVEGRELVFTVSDTGPGISAANLEHVFERYWQAKAASRKGAGLGLAISRGIVRAHHGRIWVESAPGRGSAFHFSLPLAAN